MEQISIIVQDEDKKSKDTLLRCLDAELGDDININIEDLPYCVSLNLSNKSQRSRVAGAVAEAIIDRYEQKLIGKVIRSNYFYFNTLERRKILSNSLYYISNDSDNLAGTLLAVRRINIIKRQIEEYMSNSSKIHLEGFVNFRLGSYIEELEEIVDRAADDMIVEKEYNEFIQLLKTFVELQPCKHELVHVVALENGEYRIYDGEQLEITTDYERETMKSVDDMNNEDILVSSLITIAPRRIVVHNNNFTLNNEMYNTIKQVFGYRMKTCEGCNICIKKH